MKKLIIGALSASLLAVSVLLPQAVSAKETETISYTYTAGEGKTYTREMEKLGRGLVAVKTSGGVYLSWRLLDSEDAVFGSANSNVTFNVYRGNSKIAEVTNSTNYLDATSGTSYCVAPVVNGTEGNKCAAVTVQSGNYFDIPVQQPAAASLPMYITENKWHYFVDADGNKVTDNDWRDDATAYHDVEYTINDCSTADLDGDGEYEIIVKWDAGGQDNSFNGVTGNVIIDAYKTNGKRLWRIDLGNNIRAGAHYTQFIVYDFNGDGKAEMMCKTAPGSTDSGGNYVTKCSHVTAIKNISDTINQTDYRNNGGYVLDGDEYLTIYDGTTGNALDTIYYPNQRVDAAVWGDRYGGRCDRFTAALAYMDGVKPYGVFMRGYYMRQSGGIGERQAACAVSYDGTNLDCKYSFDTYNVNNYSSKSTSASYANGVYKGVNGYVSGNQNYAGEGNHNCTVADVDNDGKDEVMTGALCYEITDSDRLGVKWCTFLEHGDALHIGDYDPTHAGFEFMTIHEDGFGKIGTPVYNKFNTSVELEYGASVIDAETGELLFHESNDNDTGRGIMANIGAGGYYQIYAYAQHDGAPTGATKFTVGPYISNGGTNFTKASNFSSMPQNFRIFWDGDLYDEILDGTKITSWNNTNNSFDTLLNASNYSCTSINSSKANPALQADIFGDWREEVIYPLTNNSALRVFTTTTPTSYKMKTLMHDPVYRSGVAAEQTAYNQPPHVGMYLSDDSVKGGVESLIVTASKTSYKVGESIDRSTLTVNAVYGNGETSEIDDYEITGYDPAATGSQVVTVSHGSAEGTFTVTMESSFTVDTSGSVTGYAGTGGTETLPMYSNGVKVTDISAGALASSGITKLYIYNDPITFGTGALPDGITIVCYGGSAAHEYAAANNISYELLEPAIYYTNVTFEETDYSGITSIVTETEDLTIGGITYHPGSRKGDNSAAIAKISKNGNSYIAISSSRFADSGRNARLTLNNTPDIAADGKYSFSMDFYIQDNTKGLSIELIDSGKATITLLQKDSNNMSPDTWYHLDIIYNGDTCTQVITDTYGSEVSRSTLPYSGKKAVNVINIPVSSQVDSTNDVYIDNISAYTPLNSRLTVNVTDKNGKEVKGASVTLDGGNVSYTTDSNGSVLIEAAGGRHTIEVTHSVLGNAESEVTLYSDTHTKTVAFDKALLNTALSVTVTDKNGDAVGGALVSVDNGTAHSTNSDGAAVIGLETTEGASHTIKASHSMLGEVSKSITASQSEQSETLAFDSTLPSDKFEIEEVTGSNVTVNAPALDNVKIYAAKYSDSALTNLIELVPTNAYRNKFTNIGFEPDKVFMWKNSGEPLDIWKSVSLLQSDYNVEISVTDTKSMPVEGATVRLTEKAPPTGGEDEEADGEVTLEASRYSVSAVTDANGIASFMNVPAGDYQIYIQHNSLGSMQRSVTLQSEDKKLSYSIKYKKSLN